MKFVQVIMVCFVLGCQGFKSPLFYDNGFVGFAPEGTPSFRLGWRDCCTTGFSTSGNTHYKFFNDFTFQADFIEDDQYNEAWHMSFNHCRFYIASWQRRAT